MRIDTHSHPKVQAGLGRFSEPPGMASLRGFCLTWLGAKKAKYANLWRRSFRRFRCGGEHSRCRDCLGQPSCRTWSTLMKRIQADMNTTHCESCFLSWDKHLEN